MSEQLSFQIKIERYARETTQYLRALASLTEDSGSIPRTHIVTHAIL